MLFIQWLFCWSLITSSLVALSARTPFYTWARLEINTIAFIPIILDPNKPEAVRATIKYFFIQAYASIIFLIGPLLTTLPEFTIFVAILIKLGISPFHNWYPAVISRLNWSAALFLSTWQKIAPLWILTENTNNFSLIPVLAALNALVGGLGGLIQTEIRPLLAFSSIGHMGWLGYALPHSNPITLFYFLSYTIHLIILMNFIYLANIDTPKDLSSSTFITGSNKIILALTLLSLGGLPPLFGFIPKLIILLISLPLSILPIFLIIGRYLNIYYYITIIWTNFITSPQPFHHTHTIKNIIHLTALIFSTLFIILICGLNIHLEP